MQRNSLTVVGIGLMVVGALVANTTDSDQQLLRLGLGLATVALAGALVAVAQATNPIVKHMNRIRLTEEDLLNIERRRAASGLIKLTPEESQKLFPGMTLRGAMHIDMRTSGDQPDDKFTTRLPTAQETATGFPTSSCCLDGVIQSAGSFDEPIRFRCASCMKPCELAPRKTVGEPIGKTIAPEVRALQKQKPPEG